MSAAVPEGDANVSFLFGLMPASFVCCLLAGGCCIGDWAD